MSDFVTFWGELFGIVCDFLMTTPIKYFTATFILIVLIGFLGQLIKIGRRE